VEILETIEVDRRSKKPKLDKEFLNKLLRTKFNDWKYEDEVRIIVKLDKYKDKSGLYFCPFSDKFQLREIILGPRCHLPINKVRAMVSHFHPSVTVIKSRIQFGDFKVIKDKKKSRLKK